MSDETKHEKYFLVGKVNRDRLLKPTNVILDNYTIFPDKASAMERADQLMADDKNVIEVSICYVSAVKTQVTTTQTTD